MITVGFTIDTTGILAEANSKRAVNKVMKEIHAEIGELWHGEMLPEHFTPGAADRYRYSPRSQGTKAIKERQHRQGYARAPNIDLVKSGKTRELTKTGIVRAWPRRGEVRFFVPHYVKKRGKRLFDLVRELQAITKAETDKMRRYAEKRLGELIAANRVKRRRGKQ